jgi:hypothetical protein
MTLEHIWISYNKTALSHIQWIGDAGDASRDARNGPSLAGYASPGMG